MTTSYPRKLYRSRDERIVAGVCGGLADYLNMEVGLVRVLFVVLTVLTGFGVGLVAYAVGALAVPEEPRDHDPIEPPVAGPPAGMQYPHSSPLHQPDDLR